MKYKQIYVNSIMQAKWKNSLKDTKEKVNIGIEIEITDKYK